MRNKLFFLFILLGLFGNTYASNPAKMDSTEAAKINKEAEDPNFVHAYIMDVSPGKAFYSTFGHAAIRMTCPSKGLDYCFSFEMNMDVSDNWEVLARKAKAGFCMIPSQTFLASYQKEGRCVTAYEINLTPKEKQELWKCLDQNVSKGANWTFDYISINCLSMMFYAINTAIMPERLEFQHLPAITQAEFGEWQDYITRHSPWVNILLHTTLITADGNQVSAEDKITPEMLNEVLKETVIIDSCGQKRPLILGKPRTLLPLTYQDEPIWFRPWMAVCLLALVGIIVAVIYYKRRQKT